MLILTLFVQLFIEGCLSPSVTEFCTEMIPVIRILQAYKGSKIVMIGDYNEHFSVYKNQPVTNMLKGNSFINANTTRGLDLLDAAYIHFRPKSKFVSDVNIF